MTTDPFIDGEEPDALDQQRADVAEIQGTMTGRFTPAQNPCEEIEATAERLGWPTDPYLTGDDEPCCFLYREMYAEDHEYGCPRRVKHDNTI